MYVCMCVCMYVCRYVKISQKRVYVFTIEYLYLNAAD